MSRIRHPNTAPMRGVTKPTLREGMMGMGMLGLKGRWWELDLECGHTVERRVRYEKGAAGGTGFAALYHPASRHKALPPPTRARCEFCAAEERGPAR